MDNTVLGGLTGTDTKGGAKAAVDSNAGMNIPAPSFTSPLNADNTLGDKFKVQAGPGVSWNSVAPGAAVGFNNVTGGQLDTNALKADTRALDAMRARATGGESPWLKMQLEKQSLGQQDASDQATKLAMSSAAAARTSAGMRGGMSAGASERMASHAASDLNMSRQQVLRQGLQDRIGLGVADDQTNMALLGQTAGLDLSHAAQNQDMGKFNINSALDASKFNSSGAFNADTFNSGQTMAANLANSQGVMGADQFNSGQQFDANKMNAGNQLGALGALNQFDMAKYGEQMKGYAANKQGDAIANGGKSGPLGMGGGK